MEANRWIALAEQAMDLLQTNLVVENLQWTAPEDPSSDAKPVHQVNMTYSFVAPCSAVTTVQESTSTLLAARALAKDGNADSAWDTLDALFGVQATNGLLPKYRYSPSNDNNLYIQGTNIPNWPLFHHSASRYLPPDTTLAHKFGLHGSGRVSAIPFHGTFVLDIFYLSNQTSDDVDRLQRNFERIFQMHTFIHDVVMRGCGNDIRTNATHANTTGTPCYNVLHPWETVFDHTSPTWPNALAQVEALMIEQDWTPTSHTDDASTTSNAMLFLLECMANATVSCPPDVNHTSYQPRHLDVACENTLMAQCPFAMLDLGYATALLKSDSDMLQVARILIDKGEGKKSSTLPEQVLQLTKWKEQSEVILEDLQWNQEYDSYLSRYLWFQNNDTVFRPHSSEWLVSPVANNFMSCWDKLGDSNRRDDMTFQLLSRQGNFSFDCGPYPLWTTGGCENDESLTSAVVYPFLNYLISSGMHRNNDMGISRYLAKSTLNLVCGLPNLEDSVGECENATFYEAYDGRTGMPFANDTCEQTSTATAGIVYNLVIPDKPFYYTPAPPIRSSWVITLVVAELVIAFSIGVSCLILSLNLLRRLNSDNEDDAFVRLLDRDSDMLGEANYFSATGSFASLDDERDEEPR